MRAILENILFVERVAGKLKKLCGVCVKRRDDVIGWGCEINAINHLYMFVEIYV